MLEYATVLQKMFKYDFFNYAIKTEYDKKLYQFIFQIYKQILILSDCFLLQTCMHKYIFLTYRFNI